jgi:molybdate transport system regulatory protein
VNQLTGVITKLERSGSIVLVDLDGDGQAFTALMIDAPNIPAWLRTGNLVGMIFKETEVSLAVGLSGKISMRNRLPCTVTKIRRGELLTVVDLSFQQHTIASAITTRSAEMLGLSIGCQVTALIKTNEIILTELPTP